MLHVSAAAIIGGEQAIKLSPDAGGVLTLEEHTSSLSVTGHSRGHNWASNALIKRWYFRR